MRVEIIPREAAELFKVPELGATTTRTILPIIINTFNNTIVV